MRLTTILMRQSRLPQKESKIVVKPKGPLALKNYVLSTQNKHTERGCLYELSMLLTCLEENEFQDKKCISELNVLKKCYATYTENMQSLQQQQEQEIPVPNTKNLTAKQVSYLLRKYPTV